MSGRLARVNGRPRAVSELTGLDARLDAGASDGAELPTTLAARCPTRIELDEAPAEYDVRYQDLVRDVFCDHERWRVGLSDRAIHERGPRAHGWGPHAGGVTMTAVRITVFQPSYCSSAHAVRVLAAFRAHSLSFRAP
jgi:hypothetical protein